MGCRRDNACFLRQIDCEIEKMELPHLGHHCELESCKRLDYLPVTCEFCKGVFCTDHGYSTDLHSCSAAHLVPDVKVDICGKCKKRKEENHQCVKKKKSHCSVAKCKSRVLIPLTCGECFQKVCPTHRFPSDHDCIKKMVGRMNLIQVCG